MGLKFTSVFNVFKFAETNSLQTDYLSIFELGAAVTLRIKRQIKQIFITAYVILSHL